MHLPDATHYKLTIRTVQLVLIRVSSLRQNFLRLSSYHTYYMMPILLLGHYKVLAYFKSKASCFLTGFFKVILQFFCANFIAKSILETS